MDFKKVMTSSGTTRGKLEEDFTMTIVVCVYTKTCPLKYKGAWIDEASFASLLKKEGGLEFLIVATLKTAVREYQVCMYVCMYVCVCMYI
jgi:hypothetical protein